MRRPKDAIPDAPVYTATMAEMENLEELLAKANELAVQYGAVRIDPPTTWVRPPLRMNPDSRFFVRIQTLPAAPFVDPELVKQANLPKAHPRKRTRRKPPTGRDDDSDEPVLVTKDSKTASRDRAARAASRSQRMHHERNQLDHKALADHLAKADFMAERAAPNPSLELPPNPACTPAISPPPEMHVPGPTALVRSDEQSALPPPTGQASAAHAFSRVPAPTRRIQPSSSSTGQPKAVREATLRLAEAFPGSAEAGPAPNATAIPPCPFSQRTAQEHMAKRTAEDQSSFPLVDALSLPQATPAAVAARGIQSNHSGAHVGYDRENEDGIIRSGEVSLTYRNAEANRNVSEIKPKGEIHVSSVQDIDACIRRPGNDARYEGQLSAVVETGTESLKRNPEELMMKGGQAEDHLSHCKTSCPRTVPLWSRDLPVSQPKVFPLTLTGIEPTDRSVTNAVIPAATNPFETPCAKVDSDKGRQDTKHTAPCIPFQAQVPQRKDIAPFGGINDSRTENGSRGLRLPCTLVRKPVPESHTRVIGQENPSNRPLLRSVPPPVHGTEQYTARTENCIHPPTMPTVLHTGSFQGEGRISQPEKISVGEIPHCSVLPPSSHKSKTAAFTDLLLPMKTDCEMVPWASYGSVRAPSQCPVKTDNMNPRIQVENMGMTGLGLSVPPRRHEKKEDSLEEKRSMVISPEGSKASIHNSSYEKKFYEKKAHVPGQHVYGSYQASLSHPILTSRHHPDGSKQMLPVALTATPFQNINMEHGVAQLNLPGPLNGNQAHMIPMLNTNCNTELRFAHRSNISPSGPTLIFGLHKTHSALRGNVNLSSSRRNVAIQTGRELVEEILAVAMCGSDLAPVKIPSDALRTVLSTDQTMNCPESEQPSLKDENGGPHKNDVMQIDTILNNNHQDILQPREEGQEPIKPKTAQAQTSNHDKHSRICPNKGASKVDLSGLNAIQDVLQKEQLTSVKTIIDGTPDRSSIFKQSEEKSLSRQRAEHPLLRQALPHASQPKETALSSEEVVLVAEKRAAPRHGHPSGKELESVSMTDVGTTNLPAKEPKDRPYAKSQTKRTPKRKMENRHSRYDQDDAGRLTKPIVFPDSGSPVSLAEYEKKAHEHHEETKMALKPCREGGPDTGNANPIISMMDMRDVDVLEVEFWNAMTTGIRGKPITVSYGVDVEAEGAFDSTEMSYVEWYGVDPTGKKVSKRKKGRTRKQTGPNTARRPRSGEHARMGSTKQTLGPCAEDPHNDADDEMGYDGDRTISKLAARRETLHTGKDKLNTSEGRSKQSKSLGPRSHVGTLNRDGLLRHMPRMPGINHSMFYIGQLFTRFCWHTEDAFLNSVSYLHPGSAEKVWYAVPPRYALAFEKYAVTNVFSPEILADKSTGQALLMNKTTMFDPRRVRRKGVEVFRVVHKPGSFVLTAPRAYHAGFNCGFNVAEAVNFANATWFPVGREASVFARQTYKPLCVPWEYLLFHEAKAMSDMGHRASGRVTTRERLITNAKVVARELNAIIMDGEMKIRKYAEGSNCRVSMLHQVDGLAKYNQVGPEFGNGAGMVCTLCAHTCHFYAEMCGSCDDSFEARCVNHFGEGHRMCLQKNHKTVVVRRHDPVLLLDILGYLETIAGIEVDLREKSRRYVGYLRTWQTPLKSSGLRLRLDLKAAASRLPPKVSKEKGSREKAVREKVIGGKATRDKRRKIRKPRGMFPQPEVRTRRTMYPPQVEVLEDFETLSSMGIEQKKSGQGEFKLDGNVEQGNKIPSLQ